MIETISLKKNLFQELFIMKQYLKMKLFLSILKKAKESGSRVILKSVNDVVMDVLDLTGFVSLFEFE